MRKLYRIRKNEEFSLIIGKRHSFASANFVMYSLDRKYDYSRVGISVSKKLGDAVDRNRIKRQVREMVKTVVDFETCPKDLIIIVRTAFLDCCYQDNLLDLEKIYKKAII